MKLDYRFSISPLLLALQTVVAARAADFARTEDVAFTAKRNNSTQHYVLMFPVEFKANEPHDVLIALHGHGGDRWQFVKDPRDECKAARDAAAAHQMLYVSPDYRAPTSWMGPKAETDMLQILDELKARFRIRKVIVCGASMGGASALTFAAIHPNKVDGVVSMNGTANHVEYANFQDAIRESFGGTKAEIPEEYKKRSAEFWPQRLTMPLAITAGGKDTYVPPQSVLRLAAAVKRLQPNVLLVYREQGGHCTNYQDATTALEFVVEKVKQWPSEPRGGQAAAGGVETRLDLWGQSLWGQSAFSH